MKPLTELKREILETVNTNFQDDWRHCGILQRFSHAPGDKDEWTVTVYCINLSPDRIDAVRKTTDENPEWVDMGDLEALAGMDVCVENIPVLVSLCMLQPAKPSNTIPRFTLEY